MWKDTDPQLYPLMPVSISLILGILVGDYVGMSVPTWVWCADMVILLVGVSTIRMRPIAQSVCILLATLCFGAWLTVEYEDSRDVYLPATQVDYEAVVVSQPQVKGKVVKCDLLITSMPEPLKVKASFLRDKKGHNERQLRVGSGIVAVSLLEKPYNYYVNSHFDYARWLRVHGFDATTFIYYDKWTPSIVSLKNLSVLERAKLRLLTWRDKLVDRFASFGLHDDQLALLSAMTLGERSQISADLRQDFSVSGGSHIMALSGLHLGIIYALLLLLMQSVMRLVAGRVNVGIFWHHAIVQMVSLLAIWIYVLLVGMSPSVVRSAVMLSIYGLASIFNRDHFSLNSLALAAIIMLVLNPLDLWDMGFQMSFLSVLGILLIVPKSHSWWVKVILLPVAAQLMVAPLIMYYFGRFSTYFLLTNLIVVPCATVILYGTILLLLLSPLAVLQHAVAYVLSGILSFMQYGVSFIAHLPGASIESIHITALQTLAIYLLLFCLYRIICLTLHPR